VITFGPYLIAPVEIALSLFAIAVLALNAYLAVRWIWSLRPKRNRYVQHRDPNYLPRPRVDCVVRDSGEFYIDDHGVMR
jgi:hypothetical protein